MRKAIITIAMLLASMALGKAQDNKGYTKEGTTFTQQRASRSSSSSDQATAYTWRDSKGNEYPIYLHTYTRGEKAGKVTCYVIRTSAKTGKDYKYYLPNGEEIAKDILKESK